MSLPKLPAEDAFLHVVYDHRYFAASLAAWREVGPAGSAASSASVNALLPGVGVLVQDALLLHARNLIDFYRATSTEPTDVVASDFDLPRLTKRLNAALVRYKDPISVHLEHITAWRDVDYRKHHVSTPRGKNVPGATRQRPNWNVQNERLASHLLSALDRAANSRTRWQTPFAELRDATQALAQNPLAGWPAHLGNKGKVNQYLRSQRLRP